MQKDIEVQGTNHKTNNIAENSLVSKSLIKDSESYTAYKRAEKIARACFLITAHIKDSDALKGKIRHLAVDLPFQTLKLVSGTLSDVELIKDVALSVTTISSLLETSQAIGHISVPNFQLMQSQIVLFLQAIETQFGAEKKLESIFTYDLWKPEALTSLTSEISTGSMQSSSAQVSQVPFDQYRDATKNALRVAHHNNPDKKHEYKKYSSDKNRTYVGNHPGVPGAAKNERQILILNTIRAKGELSIKDLTTVIKGCSEKTIQRELISLVNSGDLLKNGERRWSRYSVAN